MPKHALSFKHLLGAVPRDARGGAAPSVTDLLERSRAARGVDKDKPAAPAWSAGPDGGVHPAELLRREEVAAASAARGVAGPAPPRSWRARPKPAVVEPAARERAASVDEMERAEAFLGQTRRGESLVDMCLALTLDLLRDDTVVTDEGEEEVTMAQAMRAGVVQLSLHLRGALLAASGVVGPRLSDADIRVLLEEAPRETPTDAGGEAREWEEHDDWDKDTARPSLHHLPLMAHPSPLRLLRDVPRFTGLTLTSLDLAFATLPLERVIGVLPASLRALGLAGARARDWERGLGALGRKMRVLRTLDVSYCPLGARGTVGALFPPRTIGPQPLPSLRVLGLCGAGGDLGDEEEAPPRRKALRAAVIEGAGHWVDVRFE